MWVVYFLDAIKIPEKLIDQHIDKIDKGHVKIKAHTHIHTCTQTHGIKVEKLKVNNQINFLSVVIYTYTYNITYIPDRLTAWIFWVTFQLTLYYTRIISLGLCAYLEFDNFIRCKTVFNTMCVCVYIFFFVIRSNRFFMVHLEILRFFWLIRQSWLSFMLIVFVLFVLLLIFFSIFFFFFLFPYECMWRFSICYAYKYVCKALFLFTKLLSPMTEHMFVYLWSKYWFSKRWQHWKHRHHSTERERERISVC